ncbi:MAG TPA: hypothetical protein VKD90_29670 [Gemmataceae bacterium]|nr:hypothetical protein [Gemmataceae bacterium]
MRAATLLLLSTAVAAADPKPGDEGTPAHQKAADLVKQLGHPRYATRESAAKQLLEMGPAAVPALIAGTKAEDEEVRNRSIALLPQAKTAEWKRRAAAYLADTEGKEKHDLPLLADWEKLVGKPDAGSRKLFADMVRTNGEFLEKVAADRPGAQAAITARVRALHAQVKGPKGQIKTEIGELAAVFFADAVAPPKQMNWSARPFVSQLLANPTFPEAVDAADTSPVIRKLLVKWIDDRPRQDYSAFQQFASLAQKKPFPEAGGPLAKMAKDKQADALSVRLVAIQALGKVGGPDAAAALAEVVPDATQALGGGTDDYRLGDSALAASLTMHGKRLADFGLSNSVRIGFGTGDDNEIIMLQLYGFRSQDARAKAVEKWKKEVVEKKDEPKKK